MSQRNNNNESQFSGEYMIQDRDHMSGVGQPKAKANGSVRQAEQSSSGARQQGGDQGHKQAGRRQSH